MYVSFEDIICILNDVKEASHTKEEGFAWFSVDPGLQTVVGGTLALPKRAYVVHVPFAQGRGKALLQVTTREAQPTPRACAT